MFHLLALVLAALTVFYVLKSAEVNQGRERAEQAYERMQVRRFENPSSLRTLRILPLIDAESARDDLQTENGVAYLIRADDKTILLDVGYNKRKRHPSPLLENMRALGVSLDEIDFLVFSHLHLDHLGGMAEQKAAQFSFSQGPVETPDIPVFAPAPLSPSAFNPQMTRVMVSREPLEIAAGVYTIGVIPRHLFLMGYVEEQALAFNLEGKGIVLVIGCGHQTVQKIIARTQALFDAPIYAVFGGLHFPLKGKTLFSKIQYLVGSDRPPHRGLNEEDLRAAIDSLQAAGVQRVGISPHDSSAWSIAQFRGAFGEKYVDIRVGKEIVLS